MSKVKIGELINGLVSEIDEIDASEMQQGEKTKRYKAAASRFKNALFTDKRKYRGKGLEKRVTAATYNQYMTRARKRFDDRFHHFFEKNVRSLAAKYPLYADELLGWIDAPAAEVRQRHADLLRRLKSIMPLSEELSHFKPGTKAADRKLQRLGNKYPDWKFALADVTGENWKDGQAHMHRLFQQGVRLLEEAGPLRINHDVLYTLKLSSAERSSLQQKWADTLSEKKRNTVLIDYPAYMQEIHDILHTPEHQFSLSLRIGMAPLAFALAAVSGRRMIEIMLQGEFNATGKNTVEFTGQAKKRSEEGSTYTIYTLCDADLFIDRLNVLRSCSAASDFESVVQGYGEEDTRSENGRINAILAKAFNPWVKRFFKDDRRVYKDSRAIYARVAYEMWFRHDPRWAEVDEDVFFSEVLGHDDENTQLHYKQFKLHNFSRSWHPVEGNENQRLAALQALDDDMPAFARGDAAIRLHEEVKKIIEDAPEAKISNTALRKLGFNTGLVARYLEHAAEALGQSVGETGRYELVNESPSLVLDNQEYASELEDDDEGDADDDSLDDDEIEVDDEPALEVEVQLVEAAPEPKARPRFYGMHQLEDGTWQISFEFSGQIYNWIGPAENIKDAMTKAWKAHHG